MFPTKITVHHFQHFETAVLITNSTVMSGLPPNLPAMFFGNSSLRVLEVVATYFQVIRNKILRQVILKFCSLETSRFGSLERKLRTRRGSKVSERIPK